MKKSLNILFTFFFLTGCAVEQPKFEVTGASVRRAQMSGEMKEALAAYESQAREAEKNAAASFFPQQYWEAAVDAYTHAGRAARISGDLQRSVAHGTKALELAERTSQGLTRRVRAINDLIYGYRALRNFEKTTELVEKGLKIAQQLLPNTNDRVFWEGQYYAQQGIEMMRQSAFEKAVEAFSNAVHLQQGYLSFLTVRPRVNPATLEGNRSDLIRRKTRLGAAYRQAGKLKEALEQYQQAFEHLKEWGLKYAYLNDLYWEIGELHRQQKNFPEALENFRKALEVAESQRVPGAIRGASVRIGDILRETEKPAEAIPHYEKAIRQIESVRSLLESEEYRQSFFEGGIRPYINMMGVLLAAGREDEAFNYSERARSRAFLDVLGSKVQLSRLKSGLLEEERSLQERIAALKARLADSEEGETDRAGLRRELQAAEKAYTAFLARVRKQDKEQASLMTVEPLALKEVQEFLDPETTLIEYFVTQTGILVWVIEKEKMQFVRVELPGEKLAGLVKTLRESIFALGERDKFNETSAALYKHVLQPVLSHVRGKELIIVPHDVLHYLPFHALISPDGHYLIEKYPIYYLSSASLLQFVKEKRKAGRERVLAFGNPDLGDPQKDLQFAELEAGEVRRLYPSSAVYLRKEATEEKAKGLSSQYDILHFATHAELKEDDPLSSAVLLAKDGKEDGRLEVREVFGMDLKASLVVLSACETGLGKLSSGDELVGLTRAFIYAGTPSVMASLWKVEDSSTAVLMASFYRNLRTMSKVEALRQAQLEMIRGDARSALLARRGVGGIGRLGKVPETKRTSGDSLAVSTSHPYFWAPFILVGDGK